MKPGRKYFRRAALAVAAALLILSPACERCGGSGKIERPPEPSGLPDNPPPKAVAGMAARVPGSPLVFLYAPDLAGLISRVQGSGPAKAYLDSEGMKRFRDSRLYLKLEGRLSELTRLMGPEVSLSDLGPLAGGESGLALYDIGELQFLFLSRTDAEAIAKTALWAARDRAEEMQLGGALCYQLKSDTGKAALYYALAGNFLIVSNAREQFAEAVKRARDDDAGPGSLLDGEVFKHAFPKDLEVHDLFMFLDQAALADNRYFRHYWIYRNHDDVSWIESAVVDLAFGDGAWKERRYYAASDVPQAWQTRDLSRCLAVIGSGLFTECMSLDGGGRAAHLLAAIIHPDIMEGAPQDAAGAWTQELAPILDPAEAAAAGTTSRLEWSDGREFPSLARSVIIEVNEPGRLDLKDLRRTWARLWSADLFMGRQAELEWKDDEYGTSCSPPLFEDYSVWLDRVGPFLVVSTSGPLHREVLKRAARAEEGGQAPLFMIYKSGLDAKQAGLEYKKLQDVLAKYNDWPHYSSGRAFEHDVGSMVDSLGLAGAGREVARRGVMVTETIEASVGEKGQQ